MLDVQQYCHLSTPGRDASTPKWWNSCPPDSQCSRASQTPIPYDLGSGASRLRALELSRTRQEFAQEERDFEIKIAGERMVCTASRKMEFESMRHAANTAWKINPVRISPRLVPCTPFLRFNVWLNSVLKTSRNSGLVLPCFCFTCGVRTLVCENRGNQAETNHCALRVPCSLRRPFDH